MNETAAMQKLGDEIERAECHAQPLPTADQVRENIMRRMKVEPCPVLNLCHAIPDIIQSLMMNAWPSGNGRKRTG